MKKLLLLTVLALFIQTTAFSQSCLPEGITFSTQAEIDNFQTNYPGCTEIEGDVKISATYGTDITNLSGLNILTLIGGQLFLWNNNNLQTLSGLENITSIGGNLKFSDNSILINLSGLDNLTTIGGWLIIAGNALLNSFTGLNNVNYIGGVLDIEDNPALSSLSGLNNVTFIGGFIDIDWNIALISLEGLENMTSIQNTIRISNNASLTSLSGLDNVTFIGGYLSIYNNASLTSLSGLNNLTSIGESIAISNNSALTSLSGIDNLDTNSITDLYIHDNNSLSTCEVQSICNYLANPNGVVNIYSNATGCNNPSEVANACGDTLPCLPYGNYYCISQTDVNNFQINYPNCMDIMGDIIIRGEDITNLGGLNVLTSIGGNIQLGSYYNRNPVLNSIAGFENVTSVGGNIGIRYNDALESLTGLDNIDAGTITNLYIHSNPSLSTCEVQSICDYLASPNGFIKINDNATGCNSQEEVESACGVGIPNINAESKISIYPNPTEKEIFISGKNGIIINEVNIYNQIGQKVIHKKTIVNSIDVSMLRQGMYIIELVTDNSRIREKLIIK